jgi:quinoprotein glucose dehydrogenase
MREPVSGLPDRHPTSTSTSSSAPILADVTAEEAGEGSRPAHQAVVRVRVRSNTGAALAIEERPWRFRSPREGIADSPPNGALDRQGAAEVDLIDLTPAIRDNAREIAHRYRLGPLYTPPSLADAADGTHGTIQLPGTGGGALWEGGAVDVETGMLYVGTSTGPTLLALTASGIFDTPTSPPVW